AQLSQAGAADDGMDSHGYSLKEKGSVNQVGGLERANSVKPTRILLVLSSELPASAHTRKRRRRRDAEALQRSQREFSRRPIIAHQPHVTAGNRRCLDAIGRIAGDVRA